MLKTPDRAENYQPLSASAAHLTPSEATGTSRPLTMVFVGGILAEESVESMHMVAIAGRRRGSCNPVVRSRRLPFDRSGILLALIQEVDRNDTNGDDCRSNANKSDYCNCCGWFSFHTRVILAIVEENRRKQISARRARS